MAQNLSLPTSLSPGVSTEDVVIANGDGWCEREDLLSSMAGGFAHKPAPELHDDHAIYGLLDILQRFVSEVRQRQAGCIPLMLALHGMATTMHACRSG